MLARAVPSTGMGAEWQRGELAANGPCFSSERRAVLEVAADEGSHCMAAP